MDSKQTIEVRYSLSVLRVLRPVQSRVPQAAITERIAHGTVPNTFLGAPVSRVVPIFAPQAFRPAPADRAAGQGRRDEYRQVARQGPCRARPRDPVGRATGIARRIAARFPMHEAQGLAVPEHDRGGYLGEDKVSFAPRDRSEARARLLLGRKTITPEFFAPLKPRKDVAA
jgi:hypothetical protein